MFFFFFLSVVWEKKTSESNFRQKKIFLKELLKNVIALSENSFIYLDIQKLINQCIATISMHFI
jgi:hypothetical protein